MNSATNHEDSDHEGRETPLEQTRVVVVLLEASVVTEFMVRLLHCHRTKE
jgi:hypothetical protein